MPGEVFIWALAGVGLVMLWLCLWPAPGRADPYGELARFGQGAPGEKPGAINDEQQKFAPGPQLRHRLLGVNPEGNSVYVLDEPEQYSEFKKKPETKGEIKERKEEEEICEEEHEGRTESSAEEQEYLECVEPLGLIGPATRHFRVQKFTANGNGEYGQSASVKFNEESPAGRDEAAPGRLSVEGIAVDPRSKPNPRLYVLAVDVRKSEAFKGADETSEEIIEGSKNEPVAARLFVWEDNGKELVPAGKVGTAELVGPGKCEVGECELSAQSKTPGAALLEPTGITVDPETGDVIIMAHEDPSGHVFEDHLYNHPERGITSPDHFVLQRVSPSGEVVSREQGGRWVDTSNFFKSDEQHVTAGDYSALTPPNSPVVVGPEGEEHVDVTYEAGIVQIPADFAKQEPPRFLYERPSEAALHGEVLSSPADRKQAERVVFGGALAASPEETLYAPTLANNEQPKLEGANEGVLALSATGSVLGWAGAQNLNAPRTGAEPHYDCVIEPVSGGRESMPIVAAGSKGKVFVLAGEFIEKEMLELWEEESYTGQAYPAVIEFGPEGTGCPQAAPGVLTAEEAPGKPLERSVAMGESIKLSSYINQADALKVEWDFGDGTTETVINQFNCPPSTPAEYKPYVIQCPSTEHAFVRSGALTVTEKVYTDDLATPTVMQTTTVNVSGGSSSGPTAVLTGPLKVALGQPANFDGKASFDSAGPNQIKEYHWVFGDGQESTTTQPTVSHTYANVGLYTVSLTVTDLSGHTSAPATLPSPVAVEEARPNAPPMPPASQTGFSPSPPGATGARSANRSPPRPVPDVKLANASLSVGPEGKVGLVLSCPADERSCAGRLALRARVARSGRGKKQTSALTTLASGSFTLAGGRTKRVAVRLSANARALLARLRHLNAKLTILAHDQAGSKHTTQVAVVLRAAAVGRQKH